MERKNIHGPLPFPSPLIPFKGAFSNGEIDPKGPMPMKSRARWGPLSPKLTDKAAR